MCHDLIGKDGDLRQRYLMANPGQHRQRRTYAARSLQKARRVTRHIL